MRPSSNWVEVILIFDKSEGAFGHVYLVKEKKTGNLQAMKIIDKDNIEDTKKFLRMKENEIKTIKESVIY